MAHTYDTSLYFGGNASTYRQNYTTGSGTTLVTMGIGVRQATDRTGGAPTWGGIPMTQVNIPRKHSASPEGVAELWYTVNPSAGTTQQIYIPNPGLPQIYMNVVSFKAPSGSSTVFDTSIGGNGLSANPTLTINGKAGGVVVAELVDGNNTVVTACSPGKLLQSVLHTAMITAGQYYFPTSTADVSIWFTKVSDDWGMVVGSWKEQANTSPINGSTNGLTTLNASIYGFGALNGSTNGLTSLSSALIGFGTLSGSTNGYSILSSTLTNAVSISQISGSTNGYTTLNSSIYGFGSLNGSTNGLSTVASSIRGFGALNGSTNGLSTINSSIYGIGSLNGSTNGLSTVVSIIYGIGSLNGSTNGLTTLSSTLSNAGGGIEQISGSTNSYSILSSTVYGFGTLNGSTNGLSTINSSIYGIGSLAGYTNGLSTVNSSIYGIGSLNGFTNGFTTLSSTLAGLGTIQISGSTNGYTTLSSTLYDLNRKIHVDISINGIVYTTIITSTLNIDISIYGSLKDLFLFEDIYLEQQINGAKEDKSLVGNININNINGYVSTPFILSKIITE